MKSQLDEIREVTEMLGYDPDRLLYGTSVSITDKLNLNDDIKLIVEPEKSHIKVTYNTFKRHDQRFFSVTYTLLLGTED